MEERDRSDTVSRVRSLRQPLIAAVLVATLGTGVAAARLVGGTELEKFPTTAAQVQVTAPVGADREAVERCFADPEVGKQSVCVAELVERIGSTGRYGDALGVIETLMQKPELSMTCHGMSHSLGKQLYRQGMPLEEVYRIGWMDCAMGFPHGAIEAATEEMDRQTLAKSFDHLCDGLTGYGFLAIAECVHAIAHVVATKWDTDVVGAFETCENLSDQDLVGTCVYGVIMQYAVMVDPENPVSTATFRSAWSGTVAEQTDKIVGLCSRSEGETLSTCANIVPTLLSVLWDGDWSATHAACSAFEGSAMTECYKGIAAAALSFGGTDAANVVPVACRAGAGRLVCIEGAGGSYGFVNPDVDADTQFCSRFTGDELDACRTGYAAGAQRGKHGYEDSRSEN